MRNRLRFRLRSLISVLSILSVLLAAVSLDYSSMRRCSKRDQAVVESNPDINCYFVQFKRWYTQWLPKSVRPDLPRYVESVSVWHTSANRNYQHEVEELIDEFSNLKALQTTGYSIYPSDHTVLNLEKLQDRFPTIVVGMNTI